MALVASLRRDAGLKDVRCAFVGYRDFGDAGRVVVADFASGADIDARVLPAIRAQRASGGKM